MSIPDNYKTSVMSDHHSFIAGRQPSIEHDQRHTQFPQVKAPTEGHVPVGAASTPTPRIAVVDEAYADGTIRTRPTPQYAVLVPAKQLEHAKSRLHVGDLRCLLALEFAQHVTSTLLASSLVRSVHVLTSDPWLRLLLMDGVEFLYDSGRGLNHELENALTEPKSAECFEGPVAVVHADLPSLASTEFDTVALMALGSEFPCFVPDADDQGTTAIFTRTSFGKILFGPGSNQRFESAGMRPIDAPYGMRRDVDTIDHLEQAAARGLSGRTSRIVDILRKLGRI